MLAKVIMTDRPSRACHGPMAFIDEQMTEGSGQGMQEQQRGKGGNPESKTVSAKSLTVMSTSCRYN